MTVPKVFVFIVHFQQSLFFLSFFITVLHIVTPLSAASSFTFIFCVFVICDIDECITDLLTSLSCLELENALINCGPTLSQNDYRFYLHCSECADCTPVLWALFFVFCFCFCFFFALFAFFFCCCFYCVGGVNHPVKRRQYFRRLLL